jgi:hypothetical protein
MHTLRSAALAFALALGVLPATSVAPQAAIGISVTIAPPALPVYVQPPIPGPGYHWIPGYWAWDAEVDDYYWVPGYWSRPPRVGLLWTPGYWGWNDGVYVFHDGYWGPRVGFYGGVVYGFGYDGIGFDGGYWRGGTYFYNRAVTNISINITNVYNRPVALARPSGVSFNGGRGGLVARPTPAQIAAIRGRVAPTPAQLQHVRASAGNQALRARANHGAPPVTSLPHAVDHGQAAGAAGLPGAGNTPAGLTGAGHGAAAIGAAGAAGAAAGVAAARAHRAATAGRPLPQGALTRPGPKPGASVRPAIGRVGPAATTGRARIARPTGAMARPVVRQPRLPARQMRAPVMQRQMSRPVMRRAPAPVIRRPVR